MKTQDGHPQKPDGDDLLKKPDVAHWLGVSVGAVDNYRKNGLRAIKLGGRVLFKRKDVAKFLESRAEDGGGKGNG
jgi:excisionase family DNA binding protein